MEIRLKGSKELVGFTEEFKAGTARTLEAGPLQQGDELVEYDVRIVMHPTNIHNEIFLGYAIYADDLEHARRLPGFKPFGSGAPDKVVVDSTRRKRARAVAEEKTRRAARKAADTDPLA